MRRTFTWIALVLFFAIAIVALRTRKKRPSAPTPSGASMPLPPPPAEPPGLVVVKTTKKTSDLRRGSVEVAGVVKDLTGGTVAGAAVTVTMEREATRTRAGRAPRNHTPAE